MSRVANEALAIRRSVVVPLPPESAFELFTERASAWWPFATHSVHGARAVAAVFERHRGGRVYERTADGAEADWARVVVFDPPRRLLLEWTLDPRSSGELELRFSAEAHGTRVELEHRGWEAYGDEAETVMAGYDGGWQLVLARYTAASSEP